MKSPAFLLLTCLVVVAGFVAAAPAQSRRNTPPSQLPTEKPWNQALVRWLADVDIEEVDLKQQPVTWDGTYTDLDHLAELWVGLQGGRAYIHSGGLVVRGQPRWFVLDDGNGGGIQGAGHVKQLRWHNMGAYWYQINLPMKDGSQGNPYYHNPALAKRILVALAVEMIMVDDAMDRGRNTASLYLGGTMNGWTYAYDQVRSTLDANGRKAFDLALATMAQRLAKMGPGRSMGNMDTRGVPTLAGVYAIIDDPKVREMCVRSARDFLFGSPEGSLRNLDSDAGLFRAAGYIDEANGPETTYNGVSLYHILEGRTEVGADRNWAFLDDVLSRMYDFKYYQYFKDPDGRFDGPMGYAARTGNSMPHDQRGRAWRDITGAALYEQAHPLVGLRGGSLLPSNESMVAQVQSALQGYNGGRHQIGVTSDAEPEPWKINHQLHWPPDIPYFAGKGWAQRVRDIDPDASTSIVPMERDGARFSKVFDQPGDEEFWAFRGGSGDHQFGFFVEHVANRTWPYSSWAGGSLQTFWTPQTGIVIQSAHDKSGGDPDDNENTRVWSEIDLWAAEHVWGVRDDGVAFSNATYNDHAPASVVGQWSGASPHVTLVAGFSHGKQPGLPGESGIASTFTALPNGIRVKKDIRSDGAARVDQLWATIPIFLRDSRHQKNLPDSTIEHRTDNGWTPLDTELVTASQLRIGRDFGHGPAYIYIRFDKPRQVRLSQEVWQADYQSRNRMRNIHVDLHGNPGRTINLPRSIELVYEVLTDL